jgi:hypothetical protein
MKMRMERVSKRAIAAGVAAMFAASAQAANIGPGIGVSTTNADSGNRLNVADDSGVLLGAGTYSVNGFSYNSTGTGDVVPFLATSNGTDSYDLLWIGSSVPAGGTGTVNGSVIGNFKLNSATQVFAGFYTANGGTVAFANSGTTDHNGTVTIPQGGNSIAGFSNPNLGRTYAFATTVNPLSQTVIGPGFFSNTNADGGDRLNIDTGHPLTISAGTYNVDDFSFNGTAATGTVTPFLVRLTGSHTYQTVWVGGAVNDAIGGVSVDPTGGFTLGASDTLYAGFYTSGGGFVAFSGVGGTGSPASFGLTDHDSSFTGPTTAGDTIGGFSNPDLTRQYSFSIGVSVPEPTSLGVVLLSGLLLMRRRRSSGTMPS